MGKVESLLKQEIVRLSRREARRYAAPLRDELKRLKVRSVELSRSLQSVRAQLDAAKAKERLTKMREEVAAGKVRMRLSPKMILRLRTRLGVSQTRFAELIGASLPSITNWEKGKTTPKPEIRERILALRALKKRDIRTLDKVGGK